MSILGCMKESYGILGLLLNLGLRYDNIPWLVRVGSLRLPPVVLTPVMKGHFENSVDEICTSWIVLMIELGRFKML